MTREPAKSKKKGGADAVSLINTISSITSVNLDTFSPEPSIDGKGSHGGYCGPAVKPIALCMVGEIARDPDCRGLPISGIGGIETWRDAAEFMAMGAGSVQVCTAAMHFGFKIVEDMVSGLSNWMDAKGYRSLNLRDARQGGNNAIAEDWSFVGRLDYAPFEEWSMGGSMYMGDQGQNEEYGNENIGFRQVGIPYREARRVEGSSRWSRLRLLRLAADGITAFSNAPLKIWGLVGAVVAGATFLYAVIRVLRAIFYGVDVPGYESIFVAILFLGGMQLLTLGIMGSYIGRIFDEVKGRPLYIVRRAYGFEEAMPEDATPAPAAEPPRRIQSIR